ncbi:MAG: hypothetical protein ABIV28_00765 [Longimicrobiales bacterium]
MPDRMSTADLERSPHGLELRIIAEVERLPGVIAAAVWIENREIVDLRIHAQPGASSTILGNAVIQVVERFDVGMDPRVLRIVAATIPGLEEQEALTGGRFLILQDISLVREGSRVTCNVRLAYEAGIVTGEASEVDSESGRARAAALATLRAAEGTSDGLVLALEGLSVVVLFGRRYVAVAVEAAVRRRFATLSALSPIDSGRPLEESACLAVLRAIDRWIAL